MIKIKTATLALFIFIICAFGFTFPLTQSQSAGSAVTQAQNTLAFSTQAVAQAQSAGANVDALMATLREAADLLSKAQLANSAENYNAANDYASQCQNKLSGVADEASTLQQEAQSQKTQSSIYTILTLLISALLIISGVVSWYVLTKRERRTSNAIKSI